MIRFLLLFVFLTASFSQFGQTIADSTMIADNNLLGSSPNARRVIIDLSNPEELDYALKKIHTYKYLECVTIEGEVDAEDDRLKKLFFRLSVLKNLQGLNLSENDLLKIPDNISLFKSLQSFTVEGSPDLDIDDLCDRLTNTPLTEFCLVDNDLRSAPMKISQLKRLRKFQISGSNRLNYETLVEELAKLPSLTTFAIPVNYITELPPNIDKLRSLQILDVSDNNLLELPSQISSLKAINNLSIQGNLLMNPVSELEKLKGNNIQYLALDQEVSPADIEQIRKMFPAAQIDFPTSTNTEPPVAKKDQSKPSEPRSGELKTKRELRLLSGAYALYPSYFQGLTFNFDTLTFEDRYANLAYANVYQLTPQSMLQAGAFSLRTWLLSGETKGKRNEIWFRFPVMDQATNLNYPELRAFSGMYWVYKGPLNRKQFKRAFLQKKQWTDKRNFLGKPKKKEMRAIQWHDIRVDFNKNNSFFNITLKSDTGFVEINATPIYPNFPIEKCQETYFRRNLLYKKSLLRKAQRFNRYLGRNRRNYTINYERMEEYAWKELQMRMSDEERLMSKDEWLQYYDDIIANEKQVIDNSQLAQVYILRGLAIRSYSASATMPGLRVVSQDGAVQVDYATKNVNVDFTDSITGNKLPVSNIIVIDNKKKMWTQYTASLGLFPAPISIKQYNSFTILVELRNGNWGVVSASEIDRQNLENGRNYQFSTAVYDRNLDNIGTLLQALLK